jgi:hypothetical protein
VDLSFYISRVYKELKKIRGIKVKWDTVYEYFHVIGGNTYHVELVCCDDDSNNDFEPLLNVYAVDDFNGVEICKEKGYFFSIDNVLDFIKAREKI